MDLIREILLEIERQPFTGNFFDVNIENYPHEVVSYHLMLLDEAGLIRAEEITRCDWGAIRLTWQGHEFLEASRDDARWNKAKGMMEGTGGFVVEVAKMVLIELMKGQLPL